MFILLITIFVEKNIDRIVRNKFKNFKMNINQRFSKFFSKFVLLFSQLFNYFQQILIDKFREKLTFVFQRIIVNNEKFNDVNSLKKLIEIVNQKFHNLKNYQIVKFETFIRIDQSTSRKINVKFSIRVFISSIFKKFFVSKLIAFINFQIKKKTSSNCYKYETLNY